MDKRIFLAGLVLLLAACVERSNAPPQATMSPAAEPVIAAIGTPFYLALKIPVCAATLPMAGIFAGLAQLNTADSRLNQEDIKGHAGDAVVANCGPPYYVVTP